MFSEIEEFVENTLEYARKEKGFILGAVRFPDLKTEFAGRPALVVVRGPGYREDLRTIVSYIDEVRPVTIGVDGGADALIELGFTPDVIVGDMDSVSDEALRSGAELVVHAYPDGRAPGRERLASLGLEGFEVASVGTSEDIALLMAYELGASLIVAVGTHSNIVDFFEKGRRGMASTFLVRLKVGSILVDAKGLSQVLSRSTEGKLLTPGVGSRSLAVRPRLPRLAARAPMVSPDRHLRPSFVGDVIAVWSSTSGITWRRWSPSSSLWGLGSSWACRSRTGRRGSELREQWMTAIESELEAVRIERKEAANRLEVALGERDRYKEFADELVSALVEGRLAGGRTAVVHLGDRSSAVQRTVGLIEHAGAMSRAGRSTEQVISTNSPPPSLDQVSLGTSS